MEVDGGVQFLRLGQDRPVPLVVEVDVAIVAVRLPADQPQLLDRALQLLHGGVHVADGEGGVPAVAIWVSGDGGCQRVVRFPGQRDALGRLETLDAGRRERDHRDIDAGLVHQLANGSAELEQLVDDHISVRLAAAWEVEETAVLAHRVVPELRVPFIRVERVHPALRGEVGLEVDSLHCTAPKVTSSCSSNRYRPPRISTPRPGDLSGSILSPRYPARYTRSTITHRAPCWRPGMGRRTGSATMADSWAIYEALLEGIPEGIRIRSCLLGRSWCVVESEGSGLAMNYRGGIGEGDIRPPYVGRTVAEVAALMKSWSLPDASLGVAALNSVYNSPVRVASWLNKPVEAVKSDTAFDSLLDAMTGKNVAVVGHFPGMQAVAERCRLTVLERNPQEGDLPDFAAEYVLPEQDFVFITGTALTNKTLPRLLALSIAGDDSAARPQRPPHSCVVRLGRRHPGGHRGARPGGGMERLP